MAINEHKPSAYRHSTRFCHVAARHGWVSKVKNRRTAAREPKFIGFSPRVGTFWGVHVPGESVARTRAIRSCLCGLTRAFSPTAHRALHHGNFGYAFEPGTAQQRQGPDRVVDHQPRSGGQRHLECSSIASLGDDGVCPSHYRDGTRHTHPVLVHMPKTRFSH